MKYLEPTPIHPISPSLNFSQSLLRVRRVLSLIRNIDTMSVALLLNAVQKQSPRGVL